LLPNEPQAPRDRGRGRRRLLAAVELALVFLVVLGALTAASPSFGLTWDESTYFHYADSIRAWWQAGAPLDAASLQRYWAYDTYANPHPPFMKVLIAVGSPWAARELTFPTDYRFPHFVWIAGCLTAVYGLLRRRSAVIAAATAVAFVALQPRVFGHLLIAASDSPVALAWLLLPLLAWRLDDEEATPPRRGLLWVAFYVVAGAAAASKFTGFLALVPIGAFFLWRRRWRDAALVAGAGAWSLVCVALFSPQHWRQPLVGVLEYLRYPLQRGEAMPFSTTYLGGVYRNDLPWQYFLVMSLITVPPLLLVLAPWSVLVRGAARRLLAPLSFALGFWLLLVHLPKTPRHDEVRQFLSVYPLLGILAWMGLLAVLDRWCAARPRWATPRVAAAVCALATAMLANTVAQAHPYELSHYNALIGGLRGAEQAGMEITLYFEAVDRELLATLDRHARPRQTLFMSPYWPSLLERYVEHGLLNTPLVLLPPQTRERADWMLLVRRRHVFDEGTFLALPAFYEVRHDGVPLVKLVRTADLERRRRGAR
jgi:4-amino-4-deoxy-L-arabinose transferase-like glycosyltransferase